MLFSKSFFRVLPSLFVFVGSLSPLYASQDPNEFFDLEKMLRAMNSEFTTVLTETLLEREDTKGLETEVRSFADEFTKNISNIMFGGGMNPSLMPLKKTIHAQQRFDFLLNEKHPQLHSYSQNLHQILQDMKHSHQFVQDSLLGLIDGEIMGIVPSQLGFATDYISPDSPIRLMSLVAIRQVFTLFKQVEKLQLGFLQNVKYDHTKIEHILENFEMTLQPSTFMLEHYERALKKKEERPLTPQVSGGEVMTLDQVFDDMLDHEIMTQTSLFNRHFTLMALENVDQSCRLFLPLINVLLKDHKAVQILKNRDDDTFKGIQKVLERYKKFRTQLDTHLKKFSADLKPQYQPRPQQQKMQESQERPMLDQPKQEKIGPEITPTPKRSIKPTTIKQAEPRTQKSIQTPKSANAQNHRSVPSNQNRTNTNDSSQTEDHLTEWLLRLNASQRQTVSGKKEYRKPSEQELKEDRKQKAKQEKKEKAQLHTTTETPSLVEEMVQPKEEVTPVTYILSGNYDIFESIMTETYKGEMGPVSALIKNRFNGMAYLTDGRWHFGLPHITSNQSTVFSTTLEPLPEEDEEKAVDEQPRSVTTMHNPHKNRDKNLRRYHVSDLKKLFERGGYNLETVKQKKDICNSESLQKTHINSNG